MKLFKKKRIELGEGHIIQYTILVVYGFIIGRLFYKIDFILMHSILMLFYYEVNTPKKL
jgi:hypothetical protein